MQPAHRASTWTSPRDHHSNQSMNRSVNWLSTDQTDHAVLTTGNDGFQKNELTFLLTEHGHGTDMFTA